MAKTLIINGANFATNKVATVVLDAIPCTGITLNKSTISFDTAGSTSTITATVTPSNTTDTVSWSSSDTDVATVSGGVVTSFANGTTTITATCGIKTATCAVTVNYESGNLEHSVSYNRYFSKSSSQTYAVCSSNSSDGTYAEWHSLTGTKYAYSSTDITRYPIPIPSGTTQLQCTTDSTVKVTFMWMDSTHDHSGGTSGKYALVVNYDDTTAWNSSIANGNRTVTVPDGADSVFISFYSKTGTITEEIMNATTVKCL